MNIRKCKNNDSNKVKKKEKNSKKKYLITEKKPDERKNKINFNNQDDNNDYDNLFLCNDGSRSLNKKFANNLLFFQGSPIKQNLSSLSFFEGASEIPQNFSFCNSNDTLNISHLSPKKQLNETNIEILFKSKNEEQMFSLLKKEIGTIIANISQINLVLLEKQQKLKSIENLLNNLYKKHNEYKKVKSNLDKESNILKDLFKIMDIKFKILTSFQNPDSFLPFKDDIFNKDLESLNYFLNECKIIIDNNEKKIRQLNDLDIKFNECKETLQKETKIFIKKNNDLISIENIQKVIIKPELINYFYKIPRESNNVVNLNDFKYLYNDYIKQQNIYENYNKKYKLFEKNFYY